MSCGDPYVPMATQLVTEPCHETPTFAILVHVPTRREIKRVFLFQIDFLGFDKYPRRNFELLFTCDGNTVGAALRWKGVMMTGSDVQNLGQKSGLDKESSSSLLKLGRKEHKTTNRKRTPNEKSEQDSFDKGK